jgi:hypothetical protein
MTQHEQLIQLFRSHGYCVTLGQIMQTTLAAEYRARITELRKDGFVITCEKGKRPSENIYRMTEPDRDGQMRFA